MGFSETANIGKGGGVANLKRPAPVTIIESQFVDEVNQNTAYPDRDRMQLAESGNVRYVFIKIDTSKLTSSVSQCLLTLQNVGEKASGEPTTVLVRKSQSDASTDWDPDLLTYYSVTNVNGIYDTALGVDTGVLYGSFEIPTKTGATSGINASVRMQFDITGLINDAVNNSWQQVTARVEMTNGSNITDLIIDRSLSDIVAIY